MSSINIIDRYKDEPWVLWLLVCLCRQVKRQSWLLGIHKTIRSLDMDRDGDVPGHPLWRYSYHGIGLRLNGPDNEIIDANFHNDTLTVIDPYFFTRRILEWKQPGFPESRLKHWMPEEELIILGLKKLHGGILKSHNAYSHVFSLDEQYQGTWDYLREIEYETPSTARTALEDIHDQILHVQNSANFQKWLLEELRNKELSAPGFEAIIKCLLPQQQLTACVEALNEVNHKMAAAVKVLATIPEATIKGVLEVMHKLNAEVHHPYLAHTVCRFLLERNQEKETCIAKIKSFAAIEKVQNYFGNPYEYNFAHLLLRFSPKDGIVQLRKALRSTTPACVQEAASLMAAIDEPWSNLELINVIEDKALENEPTNQRYIVAALINSKDLTVRTVGYTNIPKSRERTEDEIGYTHDEVVEHNIDSEFKYYLELIQKDLDLLDLEKIREVVR